MSWQNPLNRRTAVRSVLGLFAGLAGFALSSSRQVLGGLHHRDANHADLYKFSEKADLFITFEQAFRENVSIALNHHALKSNDPESCADVLKTQYNDAKRAEMLVASKMQFTELAMSKLNAREKNLLASLLHNQSDEVGLLMGKIFEARRQVLQSTFDGIDNDMRNFAVNFKAGSDDKA